MITYRIVHKEYMHDTSGHGARLWGGRWNPPGIACVYTSAHLSLCLLEKLVHAQALKDMRDLALMKFSVMDSDKIYSVDKHQLKEGWENDINYTQWLGGQILENGNYLGFIVPSIIVPEENNILLLPEAIGLPEIALTDAHLFQVDSRLSGLFKK